MRVLHIVRQFWPACGGLENFVLELASEQVRAGIEAHVLTLDRVHSRPGEILSTTDKVRGIAVRRIGYFGSPRYPIAPTVLAGLNAFDIVHVHGVDFFCDYLAITKIFHGKPLVLSTHGGFFHTPRNRLLKRIFFSVVTRHSLKCFHMVFASSVNDEKIFSSITDCRLRRLDNGVDTAKLANAASPKFAPVLIYFGRFASHKGLERLVESFTALKQRIPDARLHLVGNDYDGTLGKLHARLASAQDQAAIFIHTGKDDVSLRKIISECSFFVSASEYEGFGLSLVEAMSAGLIPIVNRIPSFEQIVGSAGIGCVTDFSCPERAASEIAEYFDRTEGDHQRMRATAMESSKPYSWKQVATQFQECYEQVLGVKKRQILGIDISVLSRGGAIDYIEKALNAKVRLKVAFANANALNYAAQNSNYRAILGDFLVLNDGIGVDLASRIKFGSPFPTNLNGTDFVPDFLSGIRQRLRLYLIGSSAAVVENAARRFEQRWPHHVVVGWRSGYFQNADELDEASSAIRTAKADVVLVGMGNPQQETWIHRNAEATGAKILIGVGALFDFTAESVSRAPAWIRDARCEWIYRLIQEPRRLARRYLVGNPQFLFRAFRDRYKVQTL
jgi:alpha-1,3-mannosyltransferase